MSKHTLRDTENHFQGLSQNKKYNTMTDKATSKAKSTQKHMHKTATQEPCKMKTRLELHTS